MKKLYYKYIVIIAIVLILIGGVCLVWKNKNRTGGISDNVLYNIYPGGNELLEIEMGTYYNESQNVYCKMKLPKNYFGWAMYLNSGNENISFEMANSHELSYSVENGLLDQEEVIQQFYYSNEYLVSDEVTEIFANVFTNSQITYEGMKNQTLGAVEIGDVAFYSKGDKEYTDLDVTLYYRINDDITLQISYKGPLTEQIGVKSIASQLYKSIEVVEKE